MIATTSVGTHRAPLKREYLHHIRENRTEVTPSAVRLFVGVSLLISLSVLVEVLPTTAMLVNLIPLALFFAYAVVGLDVGAPSRRLTSAWRSRPRRRLTSE